MATSNAATTYLEHRLLNFIFKNNAAISSTTCLSDVKASHNLPFFM